MYIYTYTYICIYTNIHIYILIFNIFIFSVKKLSTIAIISSLNVWKNSQRHVWSVLQKKRKGKRKEKIKMESVQISQSNNQFTQFAENLRDSGTG